MVRTHSDVPTRVALTLYLPLPLPSLQIPLYFTLCLARAAWPSWASRSIAHMSSVTIRVHEHYMLWSQR